VVRTRPVQPDQLSDIEQRLLAERKCGWQTAYGLPWDEYCGVSLPAEDRIFCDKHERDAVDNYPNLPIPRLTKEEK
jgi:hypothetical protein